MNKDELLTAIDVTKTRVLDLFAGIDENKINSIPYADSWTAGELLQHIRKSIHGMSDALQKDSKPAERDPRERIAELKKSFLDFSIKMKSPDFIYPEKGPYDKQESTINFKEAFEALNKAAENAQLTDVVEGLPFGPVTKQELLHFVLFHTQRHLVQMTKINVVLVSKEL